MRHLRAFLLISIAMLGLATWSRAAEPADLEFETFLDKVSASQVELLNGRAGPFKALWSHADDITLSGGFGGTVEKGWESISSRLDWVGTQYANGNHTQERISYGRSGNLGYVVQRAHLTFEIPGSTKKAARDYRVTMIFRLEADGWRIIHRHADTQMTKKGTQ